MVAPSDRLRRVHGVLQESEWTVHCSLPCLRSVDMVDCWSDRRRNILDSSIPRCQTDCRFEETAERIPKAKGEEERLNLIYFSR